MTAIVDHITELSCRIPTESLARLATVLQSGFYREAQNGVSFQKFLLSLPGFTEEYIADDIGTVFLNGDAIDDLEIPLSGETATIALSAAMPGLCGTILRKGSPHAALRKKHVTQYSGNPDATISLKIKLFNSVALERGPELFRQGVCLKAADLSDFLALRPSLVAAIKDPVLAGAAIGTADLLESLSSHANILFKAT